MKDYFENYQDQTCLIYEAETLVYTSSYKGVRPLLEYLKSFGPSPKPLTVVDRIMGRGAVMLAISINASWLKTPIISQPALDLAHGHGLKVEAEKIVPYIINREGNGPCPIETSVLDINDIEEGLLRIKETIAELMSKDQS